MLIEILVASCVYAQPGATQMTCHYKDSMWIDKSHVIKFYPDSDNHYIGKTCWLKDDTNVRTLMAESCTDFAKKLKE